MGTTNIEDRPAVDRILKLLMLAQKVFNEKAPSFFFSRCPDELLEINSLEWLY